MVFAPYAGVFFRDDDAFFTGRRSPANAYALSTEQQEHIAIGKAGSVTGRAIQRRPDELWLHLI
jgi:hypothetical protein